MYEECIQPLGTIKEMYTQYFMQRHLHLLTEYHHSW